MNHWDWSRTWTCTEYPIKFWKVCPGQFWTHPLQCQNWVGIWHIFILLFLFFDSGIFTDHLYAFDGVFVLGVCLGCNGFARKQTLEEGIDWSDTVCSIRRPKTGPTKKRHKIQIKYIQVALQEALWWVGDETIEMIDSEGRIPRMIYGADLKRWVTASVFTKVSTIMWSVFLCDWQAWPSMIWMRPPGLF